MMWLLSPSVWFLFARTDEHYLWGRFDHQRPAFDSGQVLLILTIATLVAAVGLVILRLRSTFLTDSQQTLFRDLCRAHGLRASSRRLLKRLASARDLPHPAALFVEPNYFDANALPHTMHSAKADLQRLRDRIFN